MLVDSFGTTYRPIKQFMIFFCRLSIYKLRKTRECDIIFSHCSPNYQTEFGIWPARCFEFEKLEGGAQYTYGNRQSSVMHTSYFAHHFTDFSVNCNGVMK